MSVAPEREPAEPRRSRPRALLALLEGLLLLAAPGLTYLAVQPKIMLYQFSADPFISTGYVVNGTQLIQRYGTADYLWTRVGFTVPAHILDTWFGAVAGYFVFRYLLALVAVVPLFMLMRRVYGRTAGWATAGAVLLSPVVMVAWSTDYPTAASLSYLAAGAAFLFMPARGTRARLAFAAAGGAFLALAVGGHFVSLLIVGAVVLGRFAAAGSGERLAALRTLGVGLAGGVVAFGLLALGSRWYLGVTDILVPNIRAVIHYQQPVWIAAFHSTTWRWLIDDIYVLVPPMVVAAWLAASVPWRREAVTGVEAGWASATALAYAFFLFEQFIGRNWTLEYWLYAPMLWALALPLLVMTVIRVGAGAGRRTAAWAAVAGVLVVALPIGLRPFRDSMHLSLWAAAVLAAVPVALVAGARLVRWVGARALAAVAVVVSATLLVVAGPVFVLFPQQVPYATPDFGTMLFGSVKDAVDEYAVITRLPTVVPTAQQLPGGLALWLQPNPGHVVLTAAAEYLFFEKALPDPIGTVQGADVAYLRSNGVRVLVLLATDASGFDAADSTLSAQGVTVSVVREAVLSSGDVRLAVRVLAVSASG